jgi:metal-sulfur cluster biosynthetic enzyme
MTGDPAPTMVARIDRNSVAHALDRVVDPCSNAMGEPLGLREMGLTTNVEIDDAVGEVRVTLRLTSPCCAYGPTMADAARSELERIRGVASAIVEIDHGLVWTPAAISTSASERLAARRRRTRELVGVEPHDWTSWKDGS